ncbi:hypothetical protein [uncultured Bacteroides sp.]|uniref:hypothetical protein n=1 Tax=uncultured Bacteroides sp. TaxID=162156 RepID=UPI0025FB6DDF|nr:hypothetical protein [uncultured Bacteroides sp.]
MKRITAYLKGKVEEIKCSAREKRVNSALEAARINFEEQISDADIKIDELMKKLGTTDNVQSIIQCISECMDDKAYANHRIKRLEEIKAFMNEEV